MFLPRVYLEEVICETFISLLQYSILYTVNQAGQSGFQPWTQKCKKLKTLSMPKIQVLIINSKCFSCFPQFLI